MITIFILFLFVGIFFSALFFLLQKIRKQNIASGVLAGLAAAMMVLLGVLRRDVPKHDKESILVKKVKKRTRP